LKEDGSSIINSNSGLDKRNQKKSDVDHDGSALGFTVKNLNSFAMALLADLWSNGHNSNSNSNSGSSTTSQPSVIGSEREAKKMKAKILYKKLMVIDNIRLKAWKWKLEKLEIFD